MQIKFYRYLAVIFILFPGIINAQNPVVSISSPSNGAIFVVGTDINIYADASDPDGSIEKVEFYVNGNKIGEDSRSPYSFQWEGTLGNHLLTVKATDNSGLFTFSSPIFLTVEMATPNGAPKTRITSPAYNSIFGTGNKITIHADAEDTDGVVNKVELIVDGITIQEDLVSPFSFIWTATAGDHSLRVKATDNANYTGISSILNISVDNNQAPGIMFVFPYEGQSVGETTTETITVDAFDMDGTIQLVEFFVDGIKIGEADAIPYEVDWLASVTGTHTLKAIATDNLGATAFSVITIHVDAGGGGGHDSPPSVSVTLPANNAVYTTGETISIDVSALDVDGTIQVVEFFMNGKKIKESKISPYSIRWTAPVAGVYYLRTIATDNSFYRGASFLTKINVRDPNQAPKVSLALLTTGGALTVKNILVISADAFDEDGNIDSVVFFLDGKNIGKDDSYPYSVNWVAEEGDYSLTAKAIDNLNASTISSVLNITVNPDIVQGLVNPFQQQFTLTAYPNPLSSYTTISVIMLVAEKISLRVYDLSGKEIKILSNDFLNAGEHFFELDAMNLLPGLYLLKLGTPDHVKTFLLSKE